MATQEKQNDNPARVQILYMLSRGMNLSDIAWSLNNIQTQLRPPMGKKTWTNVLVSDVANGVSRG